MDVDDKFIDLGLDSIIGVEWVQAINKQYGTAIAASKVYDYPSIREFAGFLEKELNNLKSISSSSGIHQSRAIVFEDAEKGLIKTQDVIPKQSLKTHSFGLSKESISWFNEQGEDIYRKMLNETMIQSVVELHEVESSIVIVKLQDRVHKNAFSKELILGINRSFESIQSNPNYKVVILTGYDSYFASGGTKEVLLAINEGKLKFTDYNFFSIALNCKIPVIAAMQGHGIGGGWCLGLFSDFIVMSRESVYSANFMKYGFTPGAGATLIFPEKFGINLAQEILFTGKQFHGSELESKGVTFPILPRKEVLSYALKLAKELSELPRESLIALKDLMTEAIREKVSYASEKELKMHEKTYVNQPKVREKIELLYGGGLNNTSLKSTPSSSLPKQPLELISSGLPKKQRLTVQSSGGGESGRYVSTTWPQFPELIHLNQSSQGRPVFWFPGGLGAVGVFRAIARKSHRPFYGIQLRGQKTSRAPLQGIQAMAAYYVHVIQSVQPEGPYDLGGYSIGGVVAYEVTRQLQELGQAINTIVMLDSPYSTEIKKREANVSQKAAILRAVNTMLAPTMMQEKEKLVQTLINREEVNINLNDEEFIEQVITLVKTRQLNNTETELRTRIQQSSKVQMSYELHNYILLPLPYSQNVTCYYFRNKSGIFSGELEPYYVLEPNEISLDHTNYWEEWEQQFPNFYMMDVDSSSHFKLLSEPKSCEPIIDFCEKLYSKDGMSTTFMYAAPALADTVPVQVDTTSVLETCYRHNYYPIVLLHGFMGFGRDEVIGFQYWGGLNDIQEDLKNHGYETYTVSVGPVSSNWDRACELYAYLKGGRVDYGKVHSEMHGHARYGRTYPGLYPDWGNLDCEMGDSVDGEVYSEMHRHAQIKKIHLLSHSMGGQTCRTLVQLLEQGSQEEVNGTPADELSPLFQGGKSWVSSVTTISAPHNGTSLYASPIGKQFLEKISKELIAQGVELDFKLEQWNLKREDGESYADYHEHVWNSGLFGDIKDSGYWDLTPDGAKELNTWVKTQPDVYYFSWATEKTYPDPDTGYHIPKPGINPMNYDSSLFIGWYTRNESRKVPIDSSWWQNDGGTNTNFMDGPTLGSTDKIVNYNGIPQIGKWNYMGLLESCDHFEVIHSPSRDVTGWFRERADQLGSLPKI